MQVGESSRSRDKKRETVSLACTECTMRNYKTTKASDGRLENLEIKKFCKSCKKHTMHRETK